MEPEDPAKGHLQPHLGVLQSSLQTQPRGPALPSLLSPGYAPLPTPWLFWLTPASRLFLQEDFLMISFSGPHSEHPSCPLETLTLGRLRPAVIPQDDSMRCWPLLGLCVGEYSEATSGLCREACFHGEVTCAIAVGGGREAHSSICHPWSGFLGSLSSGEGFLLPFPP